MLEPTAVITNRTWKNFTTLKSTFLKYSGARDVPLRDRLALPGAAAEGRPRAQPRTGDGQRLCGSEATHRRLSRAQRQGPPPGANCESSRSIFQVPPSLISCRSRSMMLVASGWLVTG